MGVFLCALLLVLQVAAQPPGVVTGFVKSSSGIPAAGVRVFAVPVRDSSDAAAGTVYEGLAQTSGDGRYRLELPPGRYYIAAGSVGSPTYFPGVSDIRSARVFEIAAGGTFEAVDFASFTPAPPPALQSAFLIPNVIVGQLSGAVKYRDGSPVAGSVVLAIPADPNVTPASARFRTTTDASGRYRFNALLPGSYHLITGYAEQPVYFPGVRSFADARSVTVVASTTVETGDIVVPEPVPGKTVQGRIISPAGAAIEGADVRLVSRSSALPASLPTRPLTRNLSRADGSFEMRDILAGPYDLEVRVSGIVPVIRELVVADEPVNRIDITVAVATISGRISMEDGSPVPDTPLIHAVLASSVGANLVTTTTFRINADGKFSRILEPGRFQIFLDTLPSGYEVVSMKAGETDLLNAELDVTGSRDMAIDIRLGRKGLGTGDVSVKGMAVEGATSTAFMPERVILCCLDKGPFRRYAAAVQADGSFEFTSVTPGLYYAEVPGFAVKNSRVDVGRTAATGISLMAEGRLTEVQLRTVVEGASAIVSGSVELRFTSTSTAPTLATVGVNALVRIRLVPADTYEISVERLPPGYTVKSIRMGAADLLAGPFSPPAAGAGVIVVTLARAN